MTSPWRIALSVALVSVLVVAIEFGRSLGITVPIPFLLLYAAVVLAAASGGKESGAMAGALASAYVVYCGATGFGPPTLTGTAVRVVAGCFLYTGTGLMLGQVRDQRDRFLREARQQGAALEAEILARTQSLRDTVESLQRFEQFADNSADLLAMFCTDGHFIAVNRTFCQYHNVDPGTVIGKRFGEVFGHDRFDAPFRETIDSGSAGSVLHLDAVVNHPALGKRFLECDVRPLMSGDSMEVVGVIVAARDVTDARAAERALIESRDQLRNIADNLPVLIAHADRDQRYRFVNRTCAIWFGRPAEEIVGKSVFEIHGANALALEDSTEQVLRGKITFADLEVTHPDGVTRSMRSRYVPDFGPDGSVRGYYILAEDVTEQKMVEERLVQSQKLESVGQLTGGIAHDFNNLLAVIQGNAELLAKQAGRDADAAVLPILDATKRGSELIQRLLSFSRRQPLRSEPVNCAALVTGMRDLLTRTLREIVEIDISIGADLWTAQVDRGQLEHALLNLAINARDAMANGGVLSVRCSNMRLGEREAGQYPDIAPGDYVSVEVRDTGCGMTHEVAERAFEPFFTTKEIGEGSGLGLSMVYGFARQSGGCVVLSSSPGAGTTVTLLLPRAVRTETRPDEPVAEDSPAGHGERVLVIEDDGNVRSLVVRMLAGMGYRTVEAENVPAARKMLQEGGAAIDMILSDVLLPGGVSGADFADEVLRLYPGIGVVLMSGYRSDQFDDPESSGHADQEGIVQLRKPFRVAELATALRATLDRTAGRTDG